MVALRDSAFLIGVAERERSCGAAAGVAGAGLPVLLVLAGLDWLARSR